MVDSNLNQIFHALADGSRREILRRLQDGPLTVSDLAAPLPMSLAGASKHIRVLERAGLVAREIRGRTHLCRLQPRPLAEAQGWLQHYERFWNRSLDRLEQALRSEPPEENDHE